MPRGLPDASLYVSKQGKNSGRAMTNNTYIPHAREHRRNSQYGESVILLVSWNGNYRRWFPTGFFGSRGRYNSHVGVFVFGWQRLARRPVPKGVAIDLSTLGHARTHTYTRARAHTHTYVYVQKKSSGLISLRDTRIATLTYADSGHSSADSPSCGDQRSSLRSILRLHRPCVSISHTRYTSRKWVSSTLINANHN